ncbi:hypothetical protein [uncultured Brachyspira sp.]|uniref:hypothetical protein n=1 Tax=uncultured Brachyspira sp. TaxID=221953 RepID=UPI0025E02467|nr:hypothetical protein [uncultured Brachyspira sp.]
MKLKIFIISFIFIFSSMLFPAFELGITAKFGLSDSFTDLTGEVFEPRLDLNLQLGYNFPINKSSFRSMSLLFDTGIDARMISLKNADYKINQVNAGAITTGLALKFIFTPVLNSRIDLAFGISSGVKFIPIIDDLNIKPNKVPISPYINLSLENRIYNINKTMAIVFGINIFYEYMIFDKRDINNLFGGGYNINKHHSIGAMAAIGFHFGKR